MSLIPHVYVCKCGEKTPCEDDQLRVGAVFQCPACEVIAAHVTPKDGGRAWITVDPFEAGYHDLLGNLRASCSTCEGCGWEMYGIGHNDPHFRKCEDCGNPFGFPSP